MLEMSSASPSSISFLSFSLASSTTSPSSDSPIYRSMAMPDSSSSPPLKPTAFSSSPSSFHSFSSPSPFPAHLLHPPSYSSPLCEEEDPSDPFPDPYPDADICSTSSFSSHSSLTSLSPGSFPPSFSPPSTRSPSSSSPRRRTRRLALCAPRSAPQDDDPHSHLFRHFSLSLSLPTPSHRHFLLSSLLSSHPFFLLLPRHTRRRVFDEFTRHTHPPHHPLMRQGHPCDRFTVVESGHVHVGDLPPAGRGYTMGDLCLYHPTQAHVTVTAAATRLVVWTVEGEVVRYWMCKAAKERHEALLAFWTDFSLQDTGGQGAKRLVEAEVEVLVDRCDLMRYEEGDWIVPSSVSRSHYFAITEGQVATHPPTPFPLTSPTAPSALLGPGQVFAGEQVGAGVKGALPRQLSPIPKPLVDAEAAAGQGGRRKRKREEVTGPTTASSLSTIYECEGDDGGQVGDGRVARKLRRQQSDCVLPVAPPAFASHKPAVSCAAGVPRGKGVQGTEAEGREMPLMRRSVSSPAQFVSAGIGVQGQATPFAVCASATVTVVSIPMEVMEMEEMADVKRTLCSRM